MTKTMYSLAASLRTALNFMGEYKEGDGGAKYQVVQIGHDALNRFDRIRAASTLDQRWVVDLDMTATFDNDGREEVVFELVNEGRDTTIGYAAGEEHARRIVACLNSCAGISTEELEQAPDAWAKHLVPPHEGFAPVQPARRDPTTIAYIAMGVQNVVDQEGGLPDEIADRFGGEVGLIEEVIKHAPMLDELGYKAAGDEGLAGVFPYEVAKPFGERIASAIFDGEEADPRSVAADLVNRIAAVKVA